MKLKRLEKASKAAWRVLKSGAFYAWDTAADKPADEELERNARTPKRPSDSGFNSGCKLPFGLTTAGIKSAMDGFCDFLSHINSRMAENKMPRFESVVMQANFSSIVGEFCKAGIPRACPTLVANKYHNGHPDLVPQGMFPGDSVKHAAQGIEVKGSRYRKGWQGHNAEACWLMVFVFASSRPPDVSEGIPPIPFAFVEVFGAQLSESDWLFAGRKKGSKRTITQNDGELDLQRPATVFDHTRRSCGSRRRRTRAGTDLILAWKYPSFRSTPTA
jgi:hypothetical protein